jgi:polyisoprenoid-binding protein YceI
MALPLHDGTWTIDPAHTEVGFSVRHLGVSKVRGRFTGVEGKLAVGTDLADTRVDVSVDLSTVETGNADRDAHLRSGDFFNTDTHPTMSFSSTGIRADGDDYVLEGELTVNGVTRPVELAVEFNGVGTNPFTQAEQAGFSAKGSLNRKDYGIDWNVPLNAGGVLVGDKVEISIEAEVVAS